RRDVQLIRGEALFHVAHDGKRPFFVTAETTVVRAVGTAFSVRIRDDNRVEVLVTEGHVAVGAPSTDRTDRPVLPASSPVLSAGQLPAVSHGRAAIKHLQADEISRKVSWTAGYLAFQGQPLSEAIGEFNRYNLRHLVIGDPSLRNLSVGGH